MQELEARVSELTEALRQIEVRVRTLEQAASRRPVAATAAKAAPASAAAPDEAGAGLALGKLLPLGGRTLLVLAGAFVLRALTEAGAVPVAIGVGLGFAYAGTWILMAERAGRAGERLSSGFHGVAAAAIGFPLLFEASGRFGLLSPVAAATLLALLSAVALGVAAARNLEGLAWVLALGGTGTAIALMAVAGGRLAPAALYLVLLGVATLWLGYVRDWVLLRWPVAFAADLAALVVALSATRPEAAEGPGAAFLVQAALLALYLGSLATRTLFLQRRVVPFEVVQTVGALLVGLGGAVFVAGRSGIGQRGFGAVALLLGLPTYAVAFAFVEHRQRIRANFYFYSSVAMVFVLAGTWLVFATQGLALFWAAAGVASGWLARRQKSSTLAVHGAVYACGSALAAGLSDRAVEAAFSGPVGSSLPSLSSALVLALLVATGWMTGGVPRETFSARLPRLALMAAIALFAAALGAGALVPLVAGTGVGSGATAATTRTAVLVAVALALAWAGRREAWDEARWLVYPLLGLTGLKVLFQELPQGRPATLVVTFALYGAALILVPRLRHRPKPAPVSGAGADGAT